MQRKWSDASTCSEEIEQADIKQTQVTTQFNDDAGYFLQISKSTNGAAVSYTVTYGDNSSEAIEDGLHYMIMLCAELDLPVNLYERAISLENTTNTDHLVAFIECVQVANPLDVQTKEQAEQLLGLHAPKSPSVTRFGQFTQQSITNPDEAASALATFGK